MKEGDEYVMLLFGGDALPQMRSTWLLIIFLIVDG